MSAGSRHSSAPSPATTPSHTVKAKVLTRARGAWVTRTPGRPLPSTLPAVPRRARHAPPWARAGACWPLPGRLLPGRLRHLCSDALSSVGECPRLPLPRPLSRPPLAFPTALPATAHIHPPFLPSSRQPSSALPPGRIPGPAR